MSIFLSVICTGVVGGSTGGLASCPAAKVGDKVLTAEVISGGTFPVGSDETTAFGSICPADSVLAQLTPSFAGVNFLVTLQRG